MSSLGNDGWAGRPAAESAGGLRWAVRIALVTLGASVVFVIAFTSGQPRTATSQRAEPKAAAQDQRAAAPRRSAPELTRELTYRAGQNGHFFIDAVVNGVDLRFLFDSGASLVALTAEDAERIGLRSSRLRFTERSGTANGEIRVAPVTLDRIRIGQLTLYNIEGAVLESELGISLLGMSFLDQLESFEVRNGKLIMRY